MELPQLPRPEAFKRFTPHYPSHHAAKSNTAGAICCDANHRETLADAVTPQPFKVAAHPFTPGKLFTQLNRHLVEKTLDLLLLKASECSSPAGFRISQECLMVRPATQQPLPEQLLLSRLHGRHDQFPEKHTPSAKSLRNLLAVLLLFRPRQLGSPCFSAVPIDQRSADLLRLTPVTAGLRLLNSSE